MSYKYSVFQISDITEQFRADIISDCALHDDICQGSLHQASSPFWGRGQGLQCMINCLVALCYAIISHISLWTYRDMDNILYCGNDLFNKVGKFQLLLPSDMPEYITLNEMIFGVKEGVSTLGHFTYSPRNHVNMLFCDLREFFMSHTLFFIVIAGNAIAVHRWHDMFYVYDPHSRSSCGMPQADGTSVLLTFRNFQNFRRYVYCLANALNSNTFEVTHMKIRTLAEHSLPTTTDHKLEGDILQDGTSSVLCSNPLCNNSTVHTDTVQPIYVSSQSKHCDLQSNVLHNKHIPNRKRKNICAQSPQQPKKRKQDVSTTNVTTNAREHCPSLNHNLGEMANKPLRRSERISASPWRSAQDHPYTSFSKTQKHLIPPKKKQYGLSHKAQTVERAVILKHNNKKSAIHRKTYGDNFQQSVALFHKAIEHGCIFICTVCQQTHFQDNVTEYSHLRTVKHRDLLTKCRTTYLSIDGKEYVCTPCKLAIYSGRIPKLSILNGCGFPPRPAELDLFPCEERFVSPIAPYMAIRELPVGGQYALAGAVCHIPIEIGTLLTKLPRTLNDLETIAVKFKRKMCYKTSVYRENIRPHKIMQAVDYLMKNSELFRLHKVQIDQTWLDNMLNNDRDPELVNGDDASEHDTECNIQNNSDSVQLNDDIICPDDDIQTPSAPATHTFLDDRHIDPSNKCLTFAPGEGKKPIFADADTEYLCFPTIYCGQRRPGDRLVPVTERFLFQHELRNVDTRVSSNIPNIFWKMKHKQIKQISDKVHLACRRNKHKGKKITAKTLLDKDSRDQIVKLDEGYHIFRTIRNSPAYFEAKKKCYGHGSPAGSPNCFLLIVSSRH